ncbi:MAG: DUF4124 domain-containing protein [Pseudomonadales bacterium]|nr:DUF4124 domain-containing protein [Pseudomonadales bacterium]
MKGIDNRILVKSQRDKLADHRLCLLVSCLLFMSLFYCETLQSEIFKWVDDQGRVHYSEEAPMQQQSEDVSGKLEAVGNFFKFDEVVDVNWYVPPAGYQSAEVKINIDLINYELSYEDRIGIENSVAGIYESYARWFDWPQSPKRDINIKVFGQYDEFEKYQLNKNNGHSTSRSHYSRRRKEVVMLGTEFTRTTLSVLYHEASHAIMHMKYRSTPNWLNEGLAECFELIQMKGEKIFMAYKLAWVEKMKHKLREGSLQPVEYYLNISNKQWRAAPARVENSYYMIAWSLMSAMLSSQEGIDSLRAVFSNLNSSGWWKKDGGLAALFADSYPGGLTKLDGDWRRWIESR